MVSYLPKLQPTYWQIDGIVLIIPCEVRVVAGWNKIWLGVTFNVGLGLGVIFAFACDKKMLPELYFKCFSTVCHESKLTWRYLHTYNFIFQLLTLHAMDRITSVQGHTV